VKCYVETIFIANRTFTVVYLHVLLCH